MKNSTAYISIRGLVGQCGGLEVFLGFAAASVLHSVSFADTLNEDTGQGYQRPRSKAHSLDFKRYISLPDSSTIPLTFNLRSELSHAWRLDRNANGYAALHLDPQTRSLAQVDCQHRLGELHNSHVPLAFMTFIGLDLRAEMGLFVVINSKAKGLSSSLTDFHESNLLSDLATDAPHLFIARKLNEDAVSPWHRLIRYGGESTSGLKRRTSFRMMQKTISRFLLQTKGTLNSDLDEKYLLVRNFWRAVAKVFPEEWKEPRHHLLTKGVGLYSLTRLLTDFVNEARGQGLDEDAFVRKLTPLATRVDWTAKGMFADAGGQKGAMEIYHRLKKVLLDENSAR
jgi:DGQHR domain-containing protein